MRKSTIEIVSFDITYKCNLRCLHCYNSSGTQDFEEELSDEELLRIVSEISELRPRSLCFCGGEPLMRKELLIKAIKSYSFSKPTYGCNIVSNGMLLTSEVAHELYEAGVNSVQISLDGSSKESHNWIRNHDNALNFALQAINELNKANVTVNVACVPTRKNITEIDEVINICLQNNVKQLRLQPIMNLGRGSGLQDYYLDSTEYFLLARKLKKKDAEFKSKGLTIEWGDPISHLINLTTEEKSINFLHINAYGNIMISPYLPIVIGNLRKHSIQEYLDANIQLMSSNKFIKKVSNMVTTAENMRLGDKGAFPEIFTGADIILDVIEDNIEEKTSLLMNKYFLSH